MNESIRPQAVPTLTEVVDWPEVARPVPAVQHVAPDAAAQPVPAVEVPAVAVMLRAPEEQVIQRVLADLQRQVDLMLEYRLREALTPLLARAADSVIRDARGELASTLRDIVARAVAQEIARHRIR
jgi:hypothetical protein